jgi:hypothetical protein
MYRALTVEPKLLVIVAVLVCLGSIGSMETKEAILIGIHPVPLLSRVVVDDTHVESTYRQVHAEVPPGRIIEASLEAMLASIAFLIVAKSWIRVLSLPRASNSPGLIASRTTAANTPIIAMTTNSSISVKPLFFSI